MYYFVLAVFIAAYLLIRRIIDSPFGQVLKAIRANEPRSTFRWATRSIGTSCRRS